MYTARSPRFNSPEGVKAAADKCREMGIDGVVVVGGDGSFRGARDLTNAGIPCIAIPGTIDNDIASSEYTVGYDTAMNTAMEMVDRLRDTIGFAQPLQRGGSDGPPVRGYRPEYRYCGRGLRPSWCRKSPMTSSAMWVDRISPHPEHGRQHFIIVVAEGCSSVAGNDINDMARRIQEETGVETRATFWAMYSAVVLPRCVTALWPARWVAMPWICSWKARATVWLVMQKGQITDFDITEALNMPRTLTINCITTRCAFSI